MSTILKERLKEAKKKKELATITRLICSETHIDDSILSLMDIDYQNVIDVAYVRLSLSKDIHDTETMKEEFIKFIKEVDDCDEMVFLISTDENLFFLKLSAEIIKNHSDFFWSNKNLYKTHSDRIFMLHDLSRGFTVLSSEYGLETAVWP